MEEGWRVCALVCFSSQEGRALKDVWQWVCWEQPGVFCCRKREEGRYRGRGRGKRNMRGKNIIRKSCASDSQTTKRQSTKYNPSPAGSVVPVIYQSHEHSIRVRVGGRVYDFTWVSLGAEQAAHGLAWRVPEARHRRWRHLCIGQKWGEMAPVELRMPARGWGWAGDLGRAPSLPGVGWRGVRSLRQRGILVEDWGQDRTAFGEITSYFQFSTSRSSMRIDGLVEPLWCKSTFTNVIHMIYTICFILKDLWGVGTMCSTSGLSSGQTM